MSPKKSNGSDQPLTRRQIRELEEAKARLSGEANSGSGTAASASAADAPAATPQSPFAPPSAPLGAPANAESSSVPVLRTPPPPTASQPAVPAPRPVPAATTPAAPASGPARVSAATRIANGAGPTSEEAKRAPNPAVMPTNLTFAKDAFGTPGADADTRVSRRSIREVGKTSSEPAPMRSSRAARTAAPQAPDVVPPAQTSAIRRLDETGELSTITAAGQTVPESEVAATVTRKSVWATRNPVTQSKDAAEDAGLAASAAASAPESSTPAGSEFSDAERAAAADQDTAMMVAVDAELPSKSEAAEFAPNESGQAELASAESGRAEKASAESDQTELASAEFAPAEPAQTEQSLSESDQRGQDLADSLSNFAEGNTDLTFRQAVLNEALDADSSALPLSGAGDLHIEPAQVAPAVLSPVLREPATDGLPNWDDITARDSNLPTDSLADAETLGLADVGLGGVDRDQLAQADAIADVEEPIVEVDHSYTWLHYLIIVAIAAVLGMVVWKVALEPGDSTTPEPVPTTMGYSVSQTLI